jgi:hypothetical protein
MRRQESGEDFGNYRERRTRSFSQVSFSKAKIENLPDIARFPVKSCFGSKIFKCKKFDYFCTPNGVVAQMVEQRTENPCVTGSIPVDATNFKT